MKHSIFFVLFLTLLFWACNNKRTAKDDNATTKEVDIHQDTLTPKTKISVKKEYDKYGNVISIDSTYSFFYDNIRTDSLLEQRIFEAFKKDFDDQFSSLDSVLMKDYFIKHPFKMKDFYTEHFFRNHCNAQQDHLRNMIRHMDSIKNRFYHMHRF